MLDLKAKLAAAGLVTEKEIAEAEAARRRGGKPAPAPAQQRGSGLPIAALRGKPKGEIYDAVRKVVERVRLDPSGGTPSENAAPYHFPSHTGRIGKLVIEPELAESLRTGAAAIVAYMSNHGLAHAVVPPAVARDIAALMPLWLRVLTGDPEAGKIETPADKPPR
jgi:hypothetical protein